MLLWLQQTVAFNAKLSPKGGSFLHKYSMQKTILLVAHQIVFSFWKSLLLSTETENCYAFAFQSPLEHETQSGQ